MTRVPVVGQTYTFGASAVSQADTDIFQAAATIAAGDFQRSINGAGFDNMANLPTVTPAAGKRIQFVISAAETTAAGDGGEIYIVASDAAGAQWQDFAVTLRVFAADMPIATEIQSGLATGADLTAAAAALPAAVWAYTTRTLTSLSALLSSIAGAVWAWASRTLTQSAASVTATETAGHIVLHRGDYISKSITGLGDISDRAKLWVTIKSRISDPDSKSILQFEETDGLLYLNGAVADTPANGTLTVDDEVEGNITFTLEMPESSVLVPASNLIYDEQVKRESGRIQSLPGGTVDITGDVTRAIE